jgi:hypothetical protein
MLLTVIKSLKFSYAILLLIALLPFRANGQVNEESSILTRCASIFGAMIDTRENLFEVNGPYILQPRFDSRGVLISLSVFPKYWLEPTHPEWTEPDKMPVLSEVEYASLLTRLDGVTPRGKLVASGAGSVVTNSTQYFLDKYEYGYLRRGEYGPKRVRFLDIYPFHVVEGRVIKKRRDKQFSNEWYFQVLVGELNYFVSANDYLKLKPGRTQKFLAVGPVSGYCFAGHCNR